jgi:hypothetical protein
MQPRHGIYVERCFWSVLAMLLPNPQEPIIVYGTLPQFRVTAQRHTVRRSRSYEE